MNIRSSLKHMLGTLYTYVFSGSSLITEAWIGSSAIKCDRLRDDSNRNGGPGGWQRKLDQPTWGLGIEHLLSFWGWDGYDFVGCNFATMMLNCFFVMWSWCQPQIKPWFIYFRDSPIEVVPVQWKRPKGIADLSISVSVIVEELRRSLFEDLPVSIVCKNAKHNMHAYICLW